MGEADRHHLASRGYLRAWRPSKEPKRVRVRVLPDESTKLIGIADVCVKRHWLSIPLPDGTRDRSIEHVLAELEGLALPVLTGYASSGDVAPADRALVAIFLSTLSMRGRSIRESLRARGIEVGEEYLRDHPKHEDAVRFEQQRHQTGVPALELLFEELAPMTASMLASMHWRVYRDPAARLATSDHPIVYLNSDSGLTTNSPLENANIDAAFVALTPEALLFGSWTRGADDSVAAIPEGLTAWFNRSVLAQSDSHFVEPPEGVIVADLEAPMPDLGLKNDPERVANAKAAMGLANAARDPAAIAAAVWDAGRYKLAANFDPGRLPRP